MLRTPATVLALAVALAALAGLTTPVAAARPRSVAAVTLPSRDPGAAALAAGVRRAGEALAQARGVPLGDGGGSPGDVADAAATLARAQELYAAGALDDAALVLDDAIAAGLRAPHRFAGDSLLAAHVTRAAIALARGELARAGALLDRVLRWDPTFALVDAEGAPRVREAFAAAQARAGTRPALLAADLGGLCAADELLVARRLAGGRIEALRLERCKVVATAVVGELDEGVLPLLDVAPAPRREARPVWRRPWFWVAATAAAGVLAFTVWSVAESGESVDVVPHL